MASAGSGLDKRKAVALVGVLVLALLPSTAAASTQDQLDQSYSGPDTVYGGAYGGSDYGFQTFTAGITGGLDRVSLNLRTVGTFGTGGCFTPATVQIRDVATNGAPGSTVLASNTISGWSGTANTWLSTSFASEPHVDAGTQYAIVLSDPTDSCVNWMGDSTNSYTRGLSGLSFNSGANWGTAPSTDLDFMTFVDTTPPAPTLTSPANDSTTNDTTPTFTGSAGAATGDSNQITVKLYQGSGTGGTLLQTLTPTRSGSSYSVDAASLADGTYTAQASQSDAADSPARARRTPSPSTRRLRRSR